MHVVNPVKRMLALYSIDIFSVFRLVLARSRVNLSSEIVAEFLLSRFIKG